MLLEDPKRDFVTGEKIELRHRDGYFAAGHPELADPWVDRVVYRVINDFDAALASLKAGAIDFMGLRPVQYLKQTNDPRFDERIEKHVDLSSGYTYIGWNQKREIFADRRVRQALSHLVDKRNICDKVLFGLADPIESPIYPRRPEYNGGLAPWTFAPAGLGEQRLRTRATTIARTSASSRPTSSSAWASTRASAPSTGRSCSTR